MEYLTFMICKQMFGVVVSEIRYVYSPSVITAIPMAPPEIAGLLNLRGRIVTAIDMRARLGLPRRAEDDEIMAIGIEHGNESFALLIDKVGEVVSPETAASEPNPANLHSGWLGISKGVFRMKSGLMVVMDIDRLILGEAMEEAA